MNPYEVAAVVVSGATSLALFVSLTREMRAEERREAQRQADRRQQLLGSST